MCPRYSDTPATTCNSTSCSFTAGSTTYGPGFHPHHGDDVPVEDRAMPNTLILPRAWLYTLVLRGRGLPILHLILPTLVSRMPILTILTTPMSHFCLCMMQLCILYVATVGDGTGTAMGQGKRQLLLLLLLLLLHCPAPRYVTSITPPFRSLVVSYPSNDVPLR